MSQVQSQSQSQSQSSVNLNHYGTEVIVNLSRDTVVQVKINEAEFIFKGKEILSVQKRTERTEYYNPNINFGVQDSVLRENGNIYDPQVDEIIDDN